MNQSTYNEEIDLFLDKLNQDIEAQEESFRAASDRGESLVGRLTLPTYPYYRVQLNNELRNRKLPPQSMRYGTKNIIFSAILLSYLASGFGIVLFLLLFGDSLTKEIEGNSLYLYFSQPIKRGHLYITKYILVWIQSIIVAALLVVLSFGMASIFSGNISFFYPVIIFTEKSMTMIPIIQYMGQVTGVFIFVLAFCFSIHFLVSVICKKTNISLIITLLVLFEGYTLSTLDNKFIRKIAHFNPFTYLNVPKLFVGYDFRPFDLFSIENQEYYANWSLPRTMHNSQINFFNGISILFIGSIVTLLIGILCFRKNVHRWRM